MNFRKTAIALTAASALAAGSMAVTQPAHAVAEWVIPTIIAVGIGGVALGVASNNAYAYDNYGAPAGVVSVRPAGPCWVENRRRGPVQVCPR
jgi:hypothetical protein